LLKTIPCPGVFVSAAVIIVKFFAEVYPDDIVRAFLIKDIPVFGCDNVVGRSYYIIS
jgi:hypothetical protein